MQFDRAVSGGAFRSEEAGRYGFGQIPGQLEAHNILHWLVIRQVEATVTLARYDLVSLPAANVTARAAFEASLKILWMLNPADPFEQEIRWLLHLRTAVEHYSKLIGREDVDERQKTELRIRLTKADTVSVVIEKKLNERGYVVPKGKVSVWDMLKDLDQKLLYTTYINLSAFTHTNYEAGSLYRGGIINPDVGEFVTAWDWRLPLETAWRSLNSMSDCILKLVKSPIDSRSAKTLRSNFKNGVRSLRNLAEN